ncbi:MAG: zinc-finger domain-containing protein [Alcaligenaceae bacterium]|nr:zinc-finger domain-containing protein [Alcaligenaceae bacterium]
MSSQATQEPVIVTAQDLPIYCPGPNAPTWSLHPRVFLDVTKTGTASCPYCGTEYKLKEGEKVHGH